MEVAVIPKLVALLRHASHESRPPLSVTPQNEKGGVHSFFREGVEDQGSGIGIGTIIESERHDFPIAGNSAKRWAKEWTVTVKRTVHSPAYHRHSQCCVTDHSRVARPSTAV